MCVICCSKIEWYCVRVLVVFEDWVVGIVNRRGGGKYCIYWMWIICWNNYRVWDKCLYMCIRVIWIDILLIILLYKV